MFRVEPTHHQVAHHEPEVGHSAVAPRCAYLALRVNVPERLNPARQVLPKDLLCSYHRAVEPVSHIAKVATYLYLIIKKDVPSRKEDDVRVDGTSILELETGLRETLDHTVVLQLDLPINHHLRRPDIEVVPAAPPLRHCQETTPARAEIRAEANLVQAVEKLPVVARHR